jgi:hypothetical protein
MNAIRYPKLGADQSRQPYIQGEITTVQYQIDQINSKIAECKSTGELFQELFDKRNQLALKLISLKDRKSSKGANVHGDEYVMPKTSNY